LEIDWKIGTLLSDKSNPLQLYLDTNKTQNYRKMKKYILLIISIALTVFIFSTIGITIHTASTLEGALMSKVQSNLPAPAVTTSNDQTLLAQSLARPALPLTSIDEQTAISIAQANAGEATLANQTAELVNLDGKIAYEVLFDLGKVYVDGNTGIVLSNSIVITPKIAAQVASEYLPNTSIIRVEKTFLQSQDIYKVVFSTGISIYIDMKGHIIFIMNATNSVTQNATNPVTDSREHDD
jgi:hypothetical protein